MGVCSSKKAQTTQQAAPSTDVFVKPKARLALTGFDPMSYREGAPGPGDPANSLEFDGATYYFMTPDTKEAFEKDPAKYAPAYGGWCAFAMSEGKKFGIDPFRYKIGEDDDKLYVFYNGTGGDTLPKWEADEATLKAKADENWAAMTSPEPEGTAVHLGLRGFDPVSYREKPAPGDPAFASKHEGATYYFASEANKTTFDADPAKYAPAYGGWCAYAMSEGKLFDVDPYRFKIADDRLYAFYNGAGGDTLPKWEADEAAFKAKADEVWNATATAATTAPDPSPAHLALRGYDPLSYRDGTPALGDPAFSSEYEKATYYFASEANKITFDGDPAEYAAAYGGWCAFAMSEGKTFDVDPYRFKILHDKLYVFYNGVGGDTLPKWEADEAASEAKADDAWRGKVTTSASEAALEETKAAPLEEVEPPPKVVTHLALRGFDPLSYRDGSPTPGDPAFSSRYLEATYYFASEANKTTFDADPAKYAPAYGGWCAYAMSEGQLFDVDPYRFKLADDRLYAFYNGAGGDTLPKWEADEAKLKLKADQVWSAIAY
ncbi:hypothetical protein CTAYLR_003307 [Chrysophaeum taylorii]|uniref:YHS domain-containing protein n=1 Tax=Chrysophaeum taylorii TaxID=2483200 RepID=A0AAD7XM24_9STRA|nr:hypothetical protein CTAYLR_003307 [Chrysophaeum taylorii]